MAVTVSRVHRCMESPTLSAANEAFLQKCPSNKVTTGHLQRTQNDRSPAEQSAYALMHEN